MLKVFIFLLGLFFGSFLNSLIYRLKKREKIFLSRSHCPHCHHVLRWQDLIPVFSFLFLRGKCRYCKKSISLQYPVVEILTAILFLITFLKAENFLSFLFLVFFFSSLLVIFIFDLKYLEIPDQIIFPTIFLAFLYRLIFSKSSFFNYLLSGLFSFLFFFSFYFFSKGKLMGLGDSFLVLFLGLFLGFPSILLALIFAFLLGGFFSFVLLILKKKKLKDEIPFAPFLISGFFFSFFFSFKIIAFFKDFLFL